MKPRHKCALIGSELAGALRHWLGTPVGKAMISDTKHRLTPMLSGFFGYYALQIGGSAADMDLLEGSRIRRRIHLDAIGNGVDVVAEPGFLPIDGDSVDLIVLFCALEFAQDPHGILREVDRVLIPEGHVVIIGFNPLSTYGLWKLALGWKHSVPWCGSFYTGGRIRDWLSLLGFETLKTEWVAHRPPAQKPRIYQWLSPMERVGGLLFPYFGGVQIILSRKRVATLTPVRPRWRPRRSVISSDLAEPTTRNLRNDQAR